MMITAKKKLGNIAIGILFMIAIAVSLLSLVSLSDHSCTDAHCELCLSLSNIKKFFESIAGIFITSSLVSALLFTASLLKTKKGGSCPYSSPVLLKVRLLC